MRIIIFDRMRADKRPPCCCRRARTSRENFEREIISDSDARQKIKSHEKLVNKKKAIYRNIFVPRGEAISVEVRRIHRAYVK